MIGKRFLQFLLSIFLACTVFVQNPAAVRAEGGSFEVVCALQDDHVKAEKDGTARLEVTVNTWDDLDPADISLQWYKVSSSPDETNLLALTGETDAVLLLRDVNEKGEYHCIGTDSLGNEYETLFYVEPWSSFDSSSKSEDITESDDHYLYVFPRGDTVISAAPGSDVELGVDVMCDDLSKVTYKWEIYKSDPDGGIYETIDGAESYIYILKNIQEACEIRCVISDGFGNVEYMTFYIRYDNNFSARAADNFIYVSYGDSVTLRVIAEGDDLSKVTYDWEYDGNYFSNGSDTFTIDEVTTYTVVSCTVKDGFGNTTIVTFPVHIQNYFSASAVQQHFEVEKGDDVTMQVNVYGSDLSDMTIEWEIYGYDEWGFETYIKIDGATGSSYTAKNVQENASYNCVVTDKYNNTSTVYFSINIAEDKTGYIDYAGEDSIYLKPGESGKLEIIGNNFDPTDQVTWTIEYFSSISYPEEGTKITVDENGTVTAGTMYGHGVVTAHGPKNDLIFKVYVYAEPEGIEFEYEKERYVVNARSNGVKVYAYCTPGKAHYAPITYSVSDPEIANITEDGYLTGKSAGTTEVIVSYGDVSASKEVLVLDGEYADYVQTGDAQYYFSDSSAFLFVGDNYPIEFVLRSYQDSSKREFKDETIKIDVSDPSVIRLNEDSTVTALKVGEAKVTATITNGKQASYDMTVSEEPTAISFREDAEYRLPDYASYRNLFDSENSYVTLSPADISPSAFVYTSSDPSVITVYDNGGLSVRGTGVTDITVTSKVDESVTATHQFEVYASSAPTSMTKKDVPGTLYANYMYLLDVTYGSEEVNPATDWKLETDSDDTIARLSKFYSAEDSHEAIVFVYGPGNIKLTATSQANPELTQVFEFNVVDGDEPLENYSKSFILSDPETRELLGRDMDEYCLELGKPYALTLGYDSTWAVPFNDPENNFFHEVNYQKEFFEQTTLMDTAQDPSSGYGRDDDPGHVSDSDFVVFKPVKTGSDVFTYRGKTIKFTVVDKVVDVEVETEEASISNEGNVDEEIIDALSDAGVLGLGDALSEAVDTTEILKATEVPENAEKLIVTTYFDIKVQGYEKDEETNIATLSLDITPMYEVTAVDENGEQIGDVLGSGTVMITEPVTLRIPVGTAFDGYERVFVKHIKVDGTQKIYEGTIEAGYVVFENPDGFSKFVISSEPFHDHEYGEPTYEWSDDNSSVTATAVCKTDASHIVTETVQTTVKTVDATCETAGSTTYTATFTNELFSEQTKTVEIPALGHKYGEPTYEWSADNSSVTAKAVCEHDANHVITETVKTTVKTIDATCEEAGNTTYTASFTNELFSEQTKTVEIPALGHEYGEPTYEWSEDNSSVTAKAICEHDANHVVAETVLTTSETIPATEDKDGSTTYTAVFTNELFTTQTKVVVIPATGPQTIHVTGVELNKTELTLRVGKSETLIATVLPEDAEDKSVTWSSSDPSVAKVDANGKVTAVADTGIADPSKAVITATTTDGSYTASCTVMAEDPINAFVRRLYKLCFGRTPDRGGFNTWTTQLRTKTRTAESVVHAFFLSLEMENKNLPDEEWVERCYLVIMNRKADEGGKKYWLSKLEIGMSKSYVIKGLICSTEFKRICDDYGIIVGTIEGVEPRDVNQGITEFVSRCYKEVLGRKGDPDGLNYWCEKIVFVSNKKQAAIDTASHGFFHSAEYLNKHTTNDQYVRTLYRTFLGREADTGGYNYWMNKLKAGTSRDSVLNGFAYSAEFANIMAKYGIK